MGSSHIPKIFLQFFKIFRIFSVFCPELYHLYQKFIIYTRYCAVGATATHILGFSVQLLGLYPLSIFYIFGITTRCSGISADFGEILPHVVVFRYVFGTKCGLYPLLIFYMFGEVTPPYREEWVCGCVILV